MPKRPLNPESLAGTTPEPTVAAGPPSAAIASDPPGHPSGLAIIASKIAPAVEGRTVLTRARLVGWLEQQRHARIVLVTAEAGYGKSTLLADFAHRTTADCVWYRLETSDGDWITFLSYMVATLRELDPEFGRATEALLRQVAAMGSTRDVVLSQFLADLGTLKGREVLVILDDYHLVSGSEDVRLIVGRLLERAPTDLHLIMSCRVRPSLGLGRLAAQGNVAELTTSDLRFSRPEIEELFAKAYAQPLDAHACDVVVERTQGWAASLQLVSASIAVSRPSEVGTFIEALDGATGPIYDFLAEEVLSRMPPLTHRVLVHASLIDRVAAPLVAAALSVTDSAPDLTTVAAHLEEARVLGLLGGPDSGAPGERIHPLFRQFLQHQLVQATSAELIRAMHLEIARVAEQTSWLASAKHYALAGADMESMRVLGSAAGEALGTGAWGTAVEVVALIPDTTPPPAVEVIKARALLTRDHPQAALSLLEAIQDAPLTAEERALVALTKASAFHQDGMGRHVEAEVQAIASDERAPGLLREIAVSWQQMLAASHGACITDVVRLLEESSVGQLRSGLLYFAGITLHNTANAELARGNYADAERLAGQAIDQLSQVGAGSSVLASSQSIATVAKAERGRLAWAVDEATLAATESGATADAIADAAYLCALFGQTQRARAILTRFDRGDAPWSRELGSRAQAAFARLAMHVSDGALDVAWETWASIEEMTATDVDFPSRASVVKAMLAATSNLESARDLAGEALSVSTRQHAWRWAVRARILDAVTSRDSSSLATWIEEAGRHSALALLEVADPVASAVHLLRPIPVALEHSIVQAPGRWVSALARQVARRTDSSGAAASLVAKYGTIDDAEVLQAYELKGKRKPRRRGYLAELVRRVSPTVRVHDLGPTSYQIGDRLVPVTETRRKSAMLLLYLVTRPRLTATREQVMESLWPDQTPVSAVNSLHQTLFFLRRDIGPWLEGSTPSDYIRMESDMVFLDMDLFQIESVAFNRQAAAILKSGASVERGPELLKLYRGRFAPEFEYEEWADPWRTQVHGVCLHLAHITAHALAQQRRYSEAVETLGPIVLLDPLAFDLHSTLIACLAALGSNDAALAHYRSMAALHVRDLGVPAAPLEVILRSLGP